MQQYRYIDHRAQLLKCPHAQADSPGVVRCLRDRRRVHVGVCLRGCPPPAAVVAAAGSTATSPPGGEGELTRQRMGECGRCNEYNGNICELRGGCRCSFGKFLADPANRCPQGLW